MKNLGTRLGLVGAALALMGSGVVMASAATKSNSGTTYYACLRSVGGVLYGVKTTAATRCHRKDKAVTWNQTGPTGPAGITGATGSTGATGLVGPQGVPGASGPIGPAGVQGQTGSIGAQGQAGVTGAPGLPGPTGPSNLSALQGSPCTFHGVSSTVQVNQDSATGNVSIVCLPTGNVIGVSVKVGVLTSIQIVDLTTPGTVLCTNSTSCAFAGHLGDSMRVTLTSGDATSGGGSNFTFSCPVGFLGGATGNVGFEQAVCTGSLSGYMLIPVTVP